MKSHRYSIAIIFIIIGFATVANNLPELPDQGLAGDKKHEHSTNLVQVTEKDMSIANDHDLNALDIREQKAVDQVPGINIDAVDQYPDLSGFVKRNGGNRWEDSYDEIKTESHVNRYITSAFVSP